MQWRQRQPLDGATVPRTHANPGPHELLAVNLVFLVQMFGRVGGFDGIDVYYHNPAGHYHLHISNSLELTMPSDTRAC